MTTDCHTARQDPRGTARRFDSTRLGESTTRCFRPTWDSTQSATCAALDDSRPGARVRVWRAVPEGVTAISPGDWVALSEKYARAESQIEHAQVITATATASELWSEGLLEEWGYQGTAPLRAEPAAAERPLSRASFPQSARAAVASTRTAEAHTQAMTRANTIGPEVGR